MAQSSLTNPFILALNYALLPVMLWVAVLLSPFVFLGRVSSSLFNLFYYIGFSSIPSIVFTLFDWKLRKRVFALLEEELRRNDKLKILEIGPGTGQNFKFYPKKSTISTLEFNPYLDKHAAWIKNVNPTLTIENAMIGNIENASDLIPDSSFDVVVATHVFCCIQNKEAAMKEIRRILKPGGKLLIYDIVFVDKKYRAARRLQEIWTRIFSFATLGCSAGGMDLKSKMEMCGFDTSQLKTTTAFASPGSYVLPLALSCGLYGRAVKN